MGIYESSRYPSHLTSSLDFVAYLLYYPWATCASFIISCYVSTVKEKQKPQTKLLEYFLFGPLCISLFLLLSPLGLSGIFLWLLLCSNSSQEKYSYISNTTTAKLSRDPSTKKSKHVYTFCSANVLLGPECLNRLNNNTSAYIRGPLIAEKILTHSGKPLTNAENCEKNLNSGLKQRDSVINVLPNIDFLCLQEVWERFHARVLIKYLEKEFPYILYDIGEYKWRINFCMFGSGLLFASKKPILDADFKPFSFRTQHAKCATQGILCAKVLLGYEKNGTRNVGYVSNLHTQAFQGSEPAIAMQLMESLSFITKFQKNSASSTDNILFDVVCGDFNADNMSPADLDIQHHEMFAEYRDPCCKAPGSDHDWAIGTELRQMTLFSQQLSTPESFRKALINDSLRRKFVLDANVMVHSRDLMTSVVIPAHDGTIPVEPFGGRRRVDRILTRDTASYTSQVLGYGFASSLTNLTDHLPVCMSIKVESNNN